MTTPVPHPTQDYFADLKRQREEATLERRQSIERELERQRPWHETKRATELASYGVWTRYDSTVDDPEAQPIGIEDLHTIVIPTALWAKRIRDAAQKWKICPGMSCLKERPIPDVGPGFDAGERIFFAAAEGVTEDELTDMLTQAREALGPWQGFGSGQPHRECELGIWGFFKQIYRYLEGGGWHPPGSERTAKVTRAREESKAPALTRSSADPRSLLVEEPLTSDVPTSHRGASTEEPAAERSDCPMELEGTGTKLKHPLMGVLGNRLSLTTGPKSATDCLNELLRRFDGSPETLMTSQELRDLGFSSAGTEFDDCPDRVKRMHTLIIDARAFPEASVYLSTRTRKKMPKALILHSQPKSRPARRRSPQAEPNASS